MTLNTRPPRGPRPGSRARGLLWGTAALAALLATAAMTPAGARKNDLRTFSLELSELRSEDRPGPGAESPSRVTFRSELSLFGHVLRGTSGRGTRFTTYNDSLRFRSDSPLPLTAFLSRDTLHATSTLGPNITHTEDPTAYRTMLTCLFTGPALTVTYDEAMRLEKVEHLKDSCRAASYDRLRLRASLGMFLLATPPGAARAGEPWQETKKCPGFSATGYSAEIVIRCRLVRRQDGRSTVAVTADTTLGGVGATMPNGEKIDIVHDRIRLDGTIVFDDARGFPRSGEIRIEEDVRYIRPRIGSYVLEKAGKYALRLESGQPDGP